MDDKKTLEIWYSLPQKTQSSKNNNSNHDICRLTQAQTEPRGQKILQQQINNLFYHIRTTSPLINSGYDGIAHGLDLLELLHAILLLGILVVVQPLERPLSAASTLWPLSLVMVIFSDLLEALSSAVTLRMLLASTSKVTSICGVPLLGNIHRI
ncbi:Glyoxylate reductase (NADP(+)) [Striga asiatica]|uniref:Glyoxylate reductase (NADP(+)) n=1 Tax=Striga asiatica TaxID=4170 RepID=A0A5A7R245_STRAF|nr:Glyoxylate reductase (NADP(+)) [Striga asiatica]